MLLYKSIQSFPLLSRNQFSNTCPNQQGSRNICNLYFYPLPMDHKIPVVLNLPPSSPPGDVTTSQLSCFPKSRQLLLSNPAFPQFHTPGTDEKVWVHSFPMDRFLRAFPSEQRYSILFPFSDSSPISSGLMWVSLVQCRVRQETTLDHCGKLVGHGSV